jgi:diaminopimelate decarboxylase
MGTAGMMTAGSFATKMSWQLLKQLDDAYGDSFYILHKKKCENNFNEILSAFRSIYSDTEIAYSYKTNYTPWICKYFNARGGYAEVVSQMEYDLAVRIGVPSQKIIYNGPLKDAGDMEQAIISGSIVNLDSLSEMNLVREMARRHAHREIAVGVRCNFDVGEGGVSRFGVDVEGGDLDHVFKTVDGLKNCRIAGLHCHFSTAHRSVASYALRTKIMLQLSARYFRNRCPDFIDVGGGFFGKMNVDLRKQFGCAVPAYREYAAAIATQFSDAFPGVSKPRLIIEPGISMVGDVMQFVSRIRGVKTVRARKIALATGSVFNIRPTQTDKQVTMHVYHDDGMSADETGQGPVDVCGYTCMEGDCLCRGYSGSVSEGDYVVFDNVGAYTTVLKPPFIAPSPPIILYDADTNDYRLIKKREAFDEVFSSYII